MIKPLMGAALLAGLLTGCAAQQPTHYYDLSTQVSPGQATLDKTVTLGIGPVTLPQTLDRPGIVTRKNNTGVAVASFEVWAGELEPAFNRVLSDSVATRLQHDQVWSTPWDNRFRPQYQVRVFVDRFSGELNGDVSLRLTWSLLGDHGQQLISTRRYRETLPAEPGYAGYVQTLNQLLADFSVEVADTIAREIPEAGK